MEEIGVVKQKEAAAEPTQWMGFEAPLFRGSLFGMNPFALMRQFTEEMDRTLGATRTAPNGAAWSPAVEVKQKNGSLIVTAELPGLKKEDLKVNITDAALTLEGERQQEKEEKREGYYHSERSYGKFYRAIALPEGARPDQAAAEFKDGVLQITIPLAETKQKHREIPVK